MSSVEQPANPNCIPSHSFLRSTASTMPPAAIDSSTSGTSSTRPTSPTAEADRVSWNTWTNTATRDIWWPVSETSSPDQSSR